jgi:hypothetical protein
MVALAREAKMPESFTAKGNKMREGRIVTGSVFVDVPGKMKLISMLADAGLGSPEAVEVPSCALCMNYTH